MNKISSHSQQTEIISKDQNDLSLSSLPESGLTANSGDDNYLTATNQEALSASPATSQPPVAAQLQAVPATQAPGVYRADFLDLANSAFSVATAHGESTPFATMLERELEDQLTAAMTLEPTVSAGPAGRESFRVLLARHFSLPDNDNSQTPLSKPLVRKQSDFLNTEIPDRFSHLPLEYTIETNALVNQTRLFLGMLDTMQPRLAEIQTLTQNAFDPSQNVYDELTGAYTMLAQQLQQELLYNMVIPYFAEQLWNLPGRSTKLFDELNATLDLFVEHALLNSDQIDAFSLLLVNLQSRWDVIMQQAGDPAWPAKKQKVISLFCTQARTGWQNMLASFAFMAPLTNVSACVRAFSARILNQWQQLSYQGNFYRGGRPPTLDYTPDWHVNTQWQADFLNLFTQQPGQTAITWLDVPLSQPEETPARDPNGELTTAFPQSLEIPVQTPLQSKPGIAAESHAVDLIEAYQKGLSALANQQEDFSRVFLANPIATLPPAINRENTQSIFPDRVPVAGQTAQPTPLIRGKDKLINNPSNTEMITLFDQYTQHTGFSELPKLLDQLSFFSDPAWCAVETGILNHDPGLMTLHQTFADLAVALDYQGLKKDVENATLNKLLPDSYLCWTNLQITVLHFIKGIYTKNGDPIELAPALSVLYDQFHSMWRKYVTSRPYLGAQGDRISDTIKSLWDDWVTTIVQTLETQKDQVFAAAESNLKDKNAATLFVLRYNTALALLKTTISSPAESEETENPIPAAVNTTIGQLNNTLEMLQTSLATPRDLEMAMAQWPTFQAMIQQSSTIELSETGTASLTTLIKDVLLNKATENDLLLFLANTAAEGTLLKRSDLLINEEQQTGWLFDIDAIENEVLSHLPPDLATDFCNRLRTVLYDWYELDLNERQKEALLATPINDIVDQEGQIQSAGLVRTIVDKFDSQLTQGWPSPGGKDGDKAKYEADYQPNTDYYLSQEQVILALQGYDPVTGESGVPIESILGSLKNFFANYYGYYRSFCPPNKQVDETGQEVKAVREHTPYIILKDQLLKLAALADQKAHRLQTDPVQKEQERLQLQRTRAIAEGFVSELDSFLADQPFDPYWHFEYYSNGQKRMALVPQRTIGDSLVETPNPPAQQALINARNLLVDAQTDPRGAFDFLIETRDLCGWYDRLPDTSKPTAPPTLMGTEELLLSKLSVPKPVDDTQGLVDGLWTAGTKYTLGRLMERLQGPLGSEARQRFKEIKQIIEQIASLEELSEIAKILSTPALAANAINLSQTSVTFLGSLTPAEKLWVGGYTTFRVAATRREPFGEDEVYMESLRQDMLDTYLFSLTDEEAKTMANQIFAKHEDIAALVTDNKSGMALTEVNGEMATEMASLIEAHFSAKGKTSPQDVRNTNNQFCEQLIAYRKGLPLFTTTELVYATAKLGAELSGLPTQAEMDQLVTQLQTIAVEDSDKSAVMGLTPSDLSFNCQKIDRFLGNIPLEQKQLLYTHIYYDLNHNYRVQSRTWLGTDFNTTSAASNAAIDSKTGNRPLPRFWTVLSETLPLTENSSSVQLQDTSSIIKSTDQALFADHLDYFQNTTTIAPSFETSAQTEITLSRAVQKVATDISLTPVRDFETLQNIMTTAFDILEAYGAMDHLPLNENTVTVFRFITTEALQQLAGSQSGFSSETETLLPAILEKAELSFGSLARQTDDQTLIVISNYLVRVISQLSLDHDSDFGFAAESFLNGLMARVVPSALLTNIDPRSLYAMQQTIEGIIRELNDAIEAGAANLTEIRDRCHIIHKALFESYNKNDPQAVATHSRYNPYGFSQNRVTLPLALADVFSLANLENHIDRNGNSLHSLSWQTTITDTDPDIVAFCPNPINDTAVTANLGQLLSDVRYLAETNANEATIADWAVVHWNDPLALLVLNRYFDDLVAQAIQIKKDLPEVIALSEQDMNVIFSRIKSLLSPRIQEIKVRAAIDKTWALIRPQPDLVPGTQTLFSSPYTEPSLLLDDSDKLDEAETLLEKASTLLMSQNTIPGEHQLGYRYRLGLELNTAATLLSVYRFEVPPAYLSNDFAGIIEAEMPRFMGLSPSLEPYIRTLVPNLLKGGLINWQVTPEHLDTIAKLPAADLDLAKLFVGHLLCIAHKHPNKKTASFVISCLKKEYKALLATQNKTVILNEAFSCGTLPTSPSAPDPLDPILRELACLGCCSRSLLELATCFEAALIDLDQKAQTNQSPLAAFDWAWIEPLTRLDPNDVCEAVSVFETIKNRLAINPSNLPIPIVYACLNLGHSLKDQKPNACQECDFRTNTIAGFDLLESLSPGLAELSLLAKRFVLQTDDNNFEAAKNQKGLQKHLQTLSVWELATAHYFLSQNMQQFPEDLGDQDLFLWDNLQRVDKLLARATRPERSRFASKAPTTIMVSAQ